MWPSISDDEGSNWSNSVVEMDYEILLVSQFTLYGQFKKGNKPDLHHAMSTEPAREAFSECVEMYKKFYKGEKVQTGSFGSRMKVSLENDGPVTFVLES